MDNQYSRKEWLDFFRNKVSPEKKAEMEAYLDTNPELKESIEGLRYLENPEQLEEIYTRIDGKIDALIAKKKNQPIPAAKTISIFNKQFSRREILSIAASIIILFSFGLWFVIGGDDPIHNSRLYADTYEPYNIDNLTRSGDDRSVLKPGASNEIKEIFSQANNTEQNDSLFSTYLIALNEQLGAYEETNLIIALYHQMYNKSDEAQAHFSLYLKEQIGQNKDVARWYYALELIKSNQISEAKGLLDSIVEAKDYKWENAKEILDKLD